MDDFTIIAMSPSGEVMNRIWAESTQDAYDIAAGLFRRDDVHEVRIFLGEYDHRTVPIADYKKNN